MCFARVLGETLVSVPDVAEGASILLCFPRAAVVRNEAASSA